MRCNSQNETIGRLCLASFPSGLAFSKVHDILVESSSKSILVFYATSLHLIVKCVPIVPIKLRGFYKYTLSVEYRVVVYVLIKDMVL